MRSVWQTEKRIAIEILEVKGLVATSFDLYSELI